MSSFKNAYRRHRENGNQPVAGPHPDPDTSYETLHVSLDVNLQETRNKMDKGVDRQAGGQTYGLGTQAGRRVGGRQVDRWEDSVLFCSDVRIRTSRSSREQAILELKSGCANIR